MGLVSKLPSGTVTFLFTDIEGSTPLLHEYRDRYPGGACGASAGASGRFCTPWWCRGRHAGRCVFGRFCACVGRAGGGAQAALRDGLVGVRMGVDTGEPTAVEEGYVGIDVHRAARIAAAGQGGQVLVSRSTRDLVGGDELRDLGEYRLKDFLLLSGSTSSARASFRR